MEGSPKDYLVIDPFPINFTISKNNVTKVTPQVISTKGAKPHDFGYNTFSFEEVKTFNFLAGTFLYSKSTKNFQMTSSTLAVYVGNTKLFEKSVPAATDTITLKDEATNYILKISKQGYSTWILPV